MDIDAKNALTHDITAWLGTGPSSQDILQYVGRVKTDISEAIVESTDFFLLSLSGELFNLWTRNKLQEVDTLLDANDQLELTSQLSQYNIPSVVKAYTKKYPKFPQANWPNDTPDWAAKFLSRLDAGLRLRTADQFLISRAYLISILNTQALHPQIALLSQALEQLLMQEAKATMTDTVETMSASWEEFYKSLHFLPASESEKLSTLAGFPERGVLNDRLLRILGLLDGIDFANFPQEKIVSALWETYLSELLRSVLVEWESQRLLRYNTNLKQFYQEFTRFWSEDNVKAGLSASLTIQAFMPLSQEGLLQISALFSALVDNLHIQAFTDPYPTDLLVSNIVNCQNEADYQEVLTGLKQLVEAAKGDVERVELLFKQLRIVITQLNAARS